MELELFFQRSVGQLAQTRAAKHGVVDMVTEEHFPPHSARLSHRDGESEGAMGLCSASQAVCNCWFTQGAGQVLAGHSWDKRVGHSVRIRRSCPALCGQSGLDDQSLRLQGSESLKGSSSMLDVNP